MAKRWNMKWLFGLLALVGVVGLAAVMWFHAVSNEITDEDRGAIAKYVEGLPLAGSESTLESQISFIRQVQDRVLEAAPVNKGIPFGKAREPSDLLEAGYGLCFDRSRAIEKILRHRGFETRHIFIYSTRKTGSAIRSFVTPGVASHAVTEVKTVGGWLVVDSNVRWISVDAEGNPRSMSDIRDETGPGGTIRWKEDLPKVYPELQPFTFVYGLYSRHGEFYAPYNPVPDVNYGEFLYNFY